MENNDSNSHRFNRLWFRSWAVDQELLLITVYALLLDHGAEGYKRTPGNYVTEGWGMRQASPSLLSF